MSHTLISAFALAVVLCISRTTLADTISGKVIGISDGDTITLLLGGKPIKLRLHGIDCPERGQAFSTQAKQTASDLAYGKNATVVLRGRDRYRRNLAEVQIENIRLNHALVELGMCWWYRKYAAKETELQTLEQEARTQRRGLWALPNPEPPWEYRRRLKRKTSRGKLPRIDGSKNFSSDLK